MPQAAKHSRTFQEPTWLTVADDPGMTLNMELSIGRQGHLTYCNDDGDDDSDNDDDDGRRRRGTQQLYLSHYNLAAASVTGALVTLLHPPPTPMSTPTRQYDHRDAS